jgi:hypothetical protein
MIPAITNPVIVRGVAGPMVAEMTGTRIAAATSTAWVDPI